MNVELDIDHYTFKELLGVFKVHQVNETTLVHMEQTVQRLKATCAKEIVLFYLKSYKLLSFLHGLSTRHILVLEEGPILEQYLTKLKGIDSFETYHVDAILEKMVPKSVITNVVVNEIAPGTLNTVKRITQYKILNLNSCFRTNVYQTTSSQFQYTLPVEMVNVVSMRLASIEIPHTGYLFTTKNNRFLIRVQGNEYTIVIPEGNYTATELDTLLNTQYFYLSSLSNDLKYIRFSIDPRTLKSVFEWIGAPGTTFSLVFAEEAHVMEMAGWIMGFRFAHYATDIRIQSEGLFDGNRGYVYFALNDYQNNNNGVNLVGLRQTMIEQDILAKIPMIQGNLTNMNDNPLTRTRRYNGPVNLKKIQVTLYDRLGNVVDLNAMDFSFTLELEILYENFKFNNITR